MATNVLVFSGGGGAPLQYGGAAYPLVLQQFSTVTESELVLTVAGTAADNPVLVGVDGELACVVKSSAVLAATDLVGICPNAELVQLIKDSGSEPLLCQPIAADAL